MLAPPFSAVAHVRQLLRPGQVKGVGSVPVVYSESKRAEPEDQEAGPVGAPGQWPVLPAGGGGAIADASAIMITSAKLRHPYIPILFSIG